MIKIILVGASGAMGKTVAELVSKSLEYEIVAGIAEKDEEGDFPIYDSFAKIKEKADVIIDFSSRDLLDLILTYAFENNLNLVLATTGYTDEDFRKIDEASEEIALVQSGNYSIGINIMLKVAKDLAGLLDDFDIEIVEAHHKYKKDAPSGTGKMLFSAVNDGRDGKLVEKYDRFSENKAREKNEVGMSSLRAGTISGDHMVVFAGDDEVLSLSHHAASKKIFAKGALKAASFIEGKEKGRYQISDVLDK